MTDQESKAVTELADDIGALVRGGLTLDGAMRRLSRYGPPEEILDSARLLYETRVGRIRELRNPFTLVSEELQKGYWYDGPKNTDQFWPAVSDRLLPSIGTAALQDYNASSTKVITLMRPPGVEEIDTRGLVLGYVQSGKTTSFMSVIAKAADVGYRMFVVLSGITDNLRSQTQARLQEMLVGPEDAQWFLLTDEESDFHRTDNARNLLSKPDQRLLAVVKKNPYRLHRLLKWLESAGDTALRGCPILIVDDEADQASIDVGSRGRTSRINGLIKQILEKPKAGYIAYTATPFANLLVDPEDYQDLYPRDFVVDLKPGDTYYGPERIFGREPLEPEEEGSPAIEGLDIIRQVDPSDIPQVQPPRGRGAVDTWDPTLPPSLRDAIQWFLLATAARRVRAVGNPHSSMLIHTSMLATAHEKLAAPVGVLVEDLRSAVTHGDEVVLAGLERLWQSEQAAVPPGSQDELPVAWSQLREMLPQVAAGIRVIIDNYRSDDRLAYSDETPAYVIAIGGNTLSRGLTLEGLVCSYFVRAASAYDTLLQMGRWFGYHRGYGDLARVWMTTDLAAWFFDLATVEEEIRRDIRKYDRNGEAMTPLQAAVRIRTHPSMAITSAAKMRHAVRSQVSYSGTRQQTILFNHTDARWLKVNLDAGAALLAAAAADDRVTAGPNRDGRLRLRGVPSSVIIAFLQQYKFHPQALTMRSDLLRGYIARELAAEHLRTWNVVVMEHPTTTNGQVDLRWERPFNLIERTRLDMPGIAHANIKSLVSTIDRLADVDLPPAEIRAQIAGDTTDATLLTIREQVVGDVGLLALYPISKDSMPRDDNRPPDGRMRRRPMGAADHILGLGVFFPEARGGSNVTYMSADLSSQVIEDVPDNLTDIDREDEAAGAAEDLLEEQRLASGGPAATSGRDPGATDS